MSAGQTGGTGAWLINQQHAAKQAERARVSGPKRWPEGWYKDPYKSRRKRWWDGNQWTAHTWT